MPIRIDEFNVTVPDGCVIGVVGEANLPFVSAEPLELLRRQRNGETLFVRGIDPWRCDEGWWVKAPGVLRRGDPLEILRESSKGIVALQPSLRRGDGRAALLSIETQNPSGDAAHVFRSGDAMQISVRVRFDTAVEAPVVGIMIRTRIGMEVYGTNTELEQLAWGPVAAGVDRTVRFVFVCGLCPGEYTVTAASHDPDGVWHDWVEDAVAFQVTDTRYTAGVANLRAAVSIS